MTIEVVPAGDECDLALTHEGVYSEYASRTEGGWARILEGLAATVLD